MKPIARWGLIAFAAAAVAAWWLFSPGSTARRDPAVVDARTPAGSVAPAASSSSERPPEPVQQAASLHGSLKDNIAQVTRSGDVAGNPNTASIAAALYQCLRFEPGQPVRFADRANCRDLSLDDVNDLKHGLQAAADKGDVEAQLGYAYFVGDSFAPPGATADSSAVQDDKRRAMDYLDRAAVSGDLAMLLRVAGVYSEGSAGLHDDTRAYAYILAYMQAAGPSAGQLDDTYGSRLSVGQMEEARRLAQQVVTKRDARK